MKTLLDTCVISEIRHPKGSASVKAAVNQLDDDDLYLSVITLGELTKGILALPASKRKNELMVWLKTVHATYSDRILPIDADVASIWGEITALAQKTGNQVAVADGLIAATALKHGLHVMTRNVSDFEATGALLMNPWES